MDLYLGVTMDSLPLPSSVRHYRIIRRLGVGGMGVVYLAMDTRLRRQVAIKFLSKDRAGDPDLRQQLLREARAAARLEHPHICSIFDVGEHGEQPYIVMQYVKGDTLAARLRNGRMEPQVALNIGVQVREALDVAHFSGIVHRDIKPQNIVIAPDGQVKLLDFGVAQITPFGSATVETVTPTDDSFFTGMLVGTPAYMSPEQARGEKVDGRADLFALGTVLYECFTGRPAFRRESIVATLDDVLHKEPPAPSSIVPALTRAHDQLCQRL